MSSLLPLSSSETSSDEKERHKRDKQSNQEKATENAAFYMPAEYGRHLGCMMVYPHNMQVFRGEKCSFGRKAFRDVARAIAHEGKEDVHMFCNSDEDADDLRSCLKGEAKEINCSTHHQIYVHVVPSDDSWCRDTGPTFVLDRLKKTSSGKPLLIGVDWDFNAYGGPEEGCYWPCDKDRALASGIVEQLKNQQNMKSLTISLLPRRDIVLEGGSFHTDGEGTILVTEECLLNHNRNPNLSKDQIEHILLHQLGGREVIWLKRGLYMDTDTNGHVDNIACFTSPTNVALAWTDDKSDPQYEISLECYNILSTSTDANGKSIRVHKLHCPPPLYYTQEEVESLTSTTIGAVRVAGIRLAASYANFYIANEAVVVPGFGHEASDKAAVKLLEGLFPNRKVVQVYSREIVLGGGNIHCITQQIPDPTENN